MGSTLIVLLAMLGLVAIGFYRMAGQIKVKANNLEFACEYLSKFRRLCSRYVDEKVLDDECYQWLTGRGDRMQTQLAGQGMMHYRPAFASNSVYLPVVLNTVPKFRTGDIDVVLASTCDDCLVRNIGTLEHELEELKAGLLNPFICLREGVRFILSLPVYLLNWFGIISQGNTNSAIESKAFKFISGFVALIGFISSVIGIFTGWEPFLQIFQR